MSDLLPSNPEDSKLRNISKAIPSSVLSCICCLVVNDAPFISLLTCSHAEYLNNSFSIPQIQPKNLVICCQCHEMLKKIKLFKMQVEESFKILSDQETKIESSNQKHNLEVNEILSINIPQTISTTNNDQSILEVNNDIKINIEKEKQNTVAKSFPPKSLKHKDVELKNIQEALKIINNNQNSGCITLLATSLQSLSQTILGENINFFNDFPIHGNTNLTQISGNTAVLPINNATDVSTDMNKKEQMIIDETSFSKDVDFGISKKELHSPLIRKTEVIQGKDDNNMQTHQKLTRGLLNSNIRKITLTKEELMQERCRIETSQPYLRLPHRCESCLVGFQYEENLEDHLKRKHTQSKGTVLCDVCLQALNPGPSYDDHVSLHYTRFDCVTCRRRFTSHVKAAFHYKSKHGKLVLYRCRHCPYNNPLKEVLRNHLRIHKYKRIGVVDRKINIHKT